MSITPDKAPETLLASDPNALFLQRTDEINELLDSGASLSGHERNCFFLNTGDGKFATASATSGFDFYDDARAVARCDWDQDGDIDLFFANRTAPRLRFLKNTQEDAGHHLSVRLVGTQSNRDAIGARVILKSRERKILRGLRAGEGFLGQSSKWLHFGLGDSDKIDELTVHWPGGKSEVFKNLTANTRVTLKQGTGKVLSSSVPEREINLPPKKFEVPAVTSRAAVRLCSRMPLPRLESLTSSGGSEVIAPKNGRPLFLTLWASWCPACDSEFQDLVENSEELEKAGIDTLAISVNGIGEGDDTSFSDARDYLKKLDFKTTLRQAHPRLLHQLQIIADQIIAQDSPLPLPSGFLLDSTGCLVAFYRGPAPVDHLIATVQSLSDQEHATTFKNSLPYAGTWIGQARSHSVSRLVNDFIEAGFIKSGLEFAKSHKSAFDSSLAYAEVISGVGNHYGDQEKFETAITYYREALTEHEEAPLIHFNLALALERLGKIPEALQGYQRAIELDPKITVAHLNRGAILARDPKQLAEGIASLQQAVRLNPNLAASYYHLGMALERSRNFQGAFDSYRKASLLAPDHYGNAMQLAHLLERAGKVEQALVEYQKIAAIHSKNPQVPFQMGMASEKLEKFGDAIAHYRKSLDLAPNYIPALNNLAFVLATRTGHLSPGEAVNLATRAASLTQHQQPAILDTLASALIAAGDLGKAKVTLQKALPLALASKQTGLAAELKKKLEKLD